jgi:hypothetical protein
MSHGAALSLTPNSSFAIVSVESVDFSEPSLFGN